MSEQDNYVPETVGLRGPSEANTPWAALARERNLAAARERQEHIEKFGWRRTLAESLAAMQQEREAA